MSLAQSTAVARGARRGYTLIELAIVVAIVGVLCSIASISLSNGKERATVRQELGEMRSAIERVRTLAAQAGSRLGTPRLVLGPSCLNAPNSGDGNNLWIVFDAPQRARVPARLVAPGPNSDQTTVECVTVLLGAGTADYAAVAPVVPGTAFAFTSTGRLIADGGAIPATGVALILAQVNEPARRYGFRVLPSGIVCDSTDVAPTPTSRLCDQDY